MQKNCATNAAGALIVLAEVFRKARELWPLQDDFADDTVTVQIDAIKGQIASELPEQLKEGEDWVLKRLNFVSATIYKSTKPLQEGEADFAMQRVLHFSERLHPLKFPASEISIDSPKAPRPVQWSSFGSSSC
eukprot:TRINITY_DN28918_c0_g1_i2.p1 TRINITY_DN28918_c0_g1~~TRINITY_DN28918_c0_g1_i2.p1  ORF type:complete len:133 (-),score=30.24 TRINITY_DN28918_c0_g1_i2:170-568(-)